ncbi:amino acid ABC transporter permease [Leucobacter aridicollis]|uniref:His/Glu/Gln/Arg/opine family amino acid ABC transporter permease subunit n=1 Tax=Leucobacter aridicollis TaxID=283878 RepID=A0A852RGX1_9MICO|nr:amino acid ABC transporter permease [Leucobacter aridicollis]MBL3681513.1 amino acid ABC transporter permease [Leucobacter aridicollis]NYD27454.1 His/Glu/Gln/Arg/opine family amino acid ABC transporter permease subunit [Leucobacter aridicollis]
MEFIENVIGVMPKLIKAVPIVAQLALGAMVLALVLGLLIALARLSSSRILRGIAVVYVEVLRGTPLLVQLVYIYFVLPVVGVQLDPIAAGIIGLGLNYAAYLSEVYRTSILAIDSGQTEAALSLGYTPTKALWRIVIPQSFKVALGPIGNYFIAMVKDTALTSVIAVSEILKTANTLNSQTFQTVEIYTAAAVLYLALSLPLSRLVIVLEKKVRSRA